MSNPSTPTNERTLFGHPIGLFTLFVTEMWERFSYYGMRAIFTLFMVKALAFDKEQASRVYGNYTGLVYLTPLLGGYVADRFWGNRKSIMFGGFLMAVGQFLMFGAGTVYKAQPELAPTLMYAGLGCLIFGNGFFKPNISTMVGQLYPQGDKRVDSAFTIFYMGINLGAFIAPLVCGYLGDTGNAEDFRWGFLAAGIGMVLSLVCLAAFGDRTLVSPTGGDVGKAPNTARQTETAASSEAKASPMSLVVWVGAFIGLYVLFSKTWCEGDVIGSAIYALTIAAPGYIISDPSLSKIERTRIWVIYIIAFFVIFFWSAFEQAGASLTYFAEEQTNRTVGSTVVPASYFQAINAVAIVLLAPVFVSLWTLLGKLNKEPASPYKQAIGLGLLAVGYWVIAVGVKDLAPGTKVSMFWLVALYTIHTLGELCLSPIGLSMVNKLAPVKVASLLMGVWFLSTSAANKFAGTLSEYYPEPVVAVTAVENAGKAQNADLFPANYVKEKRKVNGVNVIALESIKFGEIKDEGARASARTALERDLVDNAKTFAGMKIANLYDFFMLFVYMSGASAVLLFVLCPMLLKMMHGVR